MKRTATAWAALWIASALLAVASGAGAVEPAATEQLLPPTATPAEIPYYLNKLKEAELEGERMRLNKVIHDAIVSADLSNRKVVREMDPIVKSVEAAIAGGLDRPFLAGESMWLGSAVDFYRRERLRPVIDVPETDWAQPQTSASNGFRISTYPDRILLHDDAKTRTAVEASNIHEAVISPDGKRIAYFRETDDGSRAEVWAVDTRKLRKRKIADAASVLTLLFTPDGKRVLYQEVPASLTDEAPLFSVGAGGGRSKEISRVRLLQTTVEKGTYAGNIVVYKALIHHMGTTTRDCAAVISPSGKELGRLKNGPCR